ncbi:hypothetical protein FIV42_25385 [Persicimonas caeni]|uniref:Uncharacterized protein n=1 Tax=Persicimonas caeni TaxID=2292766 RepID=A0A4Y6Q0B3_PERCE|nr:hypothetical protein [Persicimonas caeni]QDG53953.1 hypothetical protein FIV42_25385 [Persicimonas caeni]QED35174.1 hypothetical protein FRD00_25380 [Persicimonas caeni]
MANLGQPIVLVTSQMLDKLETAHPYYEDMSVAWDHEEPEVVRDIERTFRSEKLFDALLKIAEAYDETRDI